MPKRLSWQLWLLGPLTVWWLLQHVLRLIVAEAKDALPDGAVDPSEKPPVLNELHRRLIGDLAVTCQQKAFQYGVRRKRSSHLRY